jgi:hypothetical protein
VGVNLDIEELKRAEQALRESEGTFRDYAETASDWFWEIGPDYRLTLLTLARTRRVEAARESGDVLSTLRQNRKNGGLFGRLSNHVSRSVTSHIARWAAPAFQCM